jgi:flagellar basal body-associated protein FliL
VPNETKHPESEQVKGDPTSANKPKSALLHSPVMMYGLIILLICTIITPCIGIAYYKLSNNTPVVENSPEISLGSYVFAADKTADGRILGAEFSVYITALEGLDRITRTRITTHKFRIQEEIETLLRQAHTGDFDDPTLAELKQKIREQVNRVVGNRVVSDIIITNLKITQSEKKTPTATANTTSPAPWIEKLPSYISQEDRNQ